MPTGLATANPNLLPAAPATANKRAAVPGQIGVGTRATPLYLRLASVAISSAPTGWIGSVADTPTGQIPTDAGTPGHSGTTVETRPLPGLPAVLRFVGILPGTHTKDLHLSVALPVLGFTLAGTLPLHPGDDG